MSYSDSIMMQIICRQGTTAEVFITFTCIAHVIYIIAANMPITVVSKVSRTITSRCDHDGHRP